MQSNLFFFHLCSLCGFGNAITFQHVDSEAIKYTEEFIKNDLKSILDNWKAENEQTVNCKDFYGSSNSNQAEFKFLMGEMILIGELNTHVKNIIKKHSLNYFSLKTKDGKRRKCGFDGTNYIENVGRFFTNNDTTPAKVRKDAGELRDDLYNKLRDFLNRKGVNGEKLQQLDINRLSISTHSNNSISGEIYCILCGENSAKLFSINSKHSESDNQIYWIFSNYNKHLKSAHQISVEEKQKILKSKPEPKQVSRKIKKDVRNSQSSSEHCYIRSNTNFIENDDIDGDQKNTNATAVEVEIIEETYFESCDTPKDQTCISLEIEPIEKEEMSFDILENLIYEKISRQTLKMTEIFMINDEKCEVMKSNNINEIDDIDVALIPGDGDCLFSALAHQLFGNKIDTVEHKNAVTKLRKDVVEYIGKYLSDFKQALRGRILSIKEEKCGKQTKIEVGNFEKEAKAFLENDLSKNGFWAGAESVKAVSLIHECNILMIRERETVRFTNGFNTNLGKTAIIAFRYNNAFGKVANSGETWNHYDSVVNINTDSILKISKAMAAREVNQVNQEKLSSETIYLSD